jgi:hypothetical protein
MGKKDIKDLKQFLSPFGTEITELTLWLRTFVWELYPKANELIYDNYQALAFGWSPTDRVGHTFCNIAVGRSTKNVHFGFYWGTEIADPKHLLIGNGNQYRYFLVKNKKEFPETYIRQLLKEAYTNSVSKVKDPKLFVEGKTIVKAISKVKRVSKSKPPGK